MIIVTGGAGFIGSNLIKFLNSKGYKNIIVVDTLEKKNYFRNLIELQFIDFINYKKGKEYIYDSIKNYNVEIIFHIGANTDVLIDNGNIMLEENFEHSKFWFNFAREREIPLIYASSSAVYGNSKCFKIDISCEKPHNEYAFSKWIFDNYVRANLEKVRNKVIGFRFFNVFGWGEFHKGKNASLPYRFFEFIKNNECIELFKEKIKRDYVYVEDICKVLYKTWKGNLLDNGIYNLGSGETISHKELAQLVVETMVEEGVIQANKQYIKFIPIPKDLKDRFQYFTKAENMPDWIRNITKNPKEKIKNYIKKLCQKFYSEV